MLRLAYVGIAFSLVFYVVFGLAVRFMELSKKARNKARLFVIVTTVTIFSISGAVAGIINLQLGRYVYAAGFLIFSIVAIIAVISIIVELHQIETRVRMRRFMVLFDIVDRYINEGKTQEEIMDYLTGKQKLGTKEASDFLEFISDPGNHAFLTDVNNEIQAAKMLRKVEVEKQERVS